MGESIRELKKQAAALPPLVYEITLGVYILSMLARQVAWSGGLASLGETAQTVLTAAALLLTGIQLAAIFSGWLKKGWAMALCIVAAGLALFGMARMQRIYFEPLMFALLVLGSYGKDFKRIVKTYALAAIAALAVAAVGLAAGYTEEVTKSGLYGTGHAFGTIHPDVWGTWAFLVIVAAWYLYLKDRPLIAWPIAWALAAFMAFVPKDRTAAALLILLPPAALIAEKAGGKKAVGWLYALVPAACLAATLILAANREWLAVHTAGTYIENFGKRFIQAGIALKAHGLTLIGEPIFFEEGVTEVLAGRPTNLYVMDNAYAAYAIQRGLIWLAACLVWMGWTCLTARKRGHWPVCAIVALMAILALMERAGLDIWYNFAFLYPLAATTQRQERS